MFSIWSTPFIIPVAAIAAWAFVTWMKIRHGVHDHPRWHQDPKNLKVPPMFEKLVAKAMEERDTEIKSLKERIEVLEKIVTDTHRSHNLADEIDKLRDSK